MSDLGEALADEANAAKNSAGPLIDQLPRRCTRHEMLPHFDGGA